MRSPIEDYVKAVKKADREIEIALYGKQLSTRRDHIQESKKVYNRKRMPKVSLEF